MHAVLLPMWSAAQLKPGSHHQLQQPRRVLLLAVFYLESFPKLFAVHLFFFVLQMQNRALELRRLEAIVVSCDEAISAAASR